MKTKAELESENAELRRLLAGRDVVIAKIYARLKLAEDQADLPQLRMPEDLRGKFERMAKTGCYR